MAYTNFLLKKIMKRKSIYFIVVIMIGLCSLLYWNNSRNLKNNRINPAIELPQRIKDYEGYEKNAQGKNKEELKTQKEFLEKMLASWKKGDEEEYLNQQVNLLEYQVKTSSKEMLSRIPNIPGQVNTVEKMLLLAKNQQKNQTGVEISGYEKKGATFLYHTVKLFGPFLITAFLLFTCAPLATAPFKNRWNIEKGLPLSAGKKILLRTLALFTVGFVALFLFYFICFAVATLQHGMGSFSYPIFVYSLKDYWLEPLWQVLGKTFILQLVTLLTIIVTLQLLAQLTRNSLVTLFLSILLILGSYYGLIKSPDLTIAPFIPTYYLNAASLVEGVPQALAQNETVTFSLGLFVNSMYSLVGLLGIWGLERKGVA